jgi:hypothetical protein
LRARYYNPAIARFQTRDIWPGDYNQPMSYNAWLYTYANPIILTDPSGKVPYNRQAAATYARKWATNINPQYGSFSDSDCTNFVSQALKAGGFPEDNEWFFDRTFNQSPGRCTGYHYPTPIKCGWYCDEGDFVDNLANSYIDMNFRAFCGETWALTDNFYKYLIRKGFKTTKIRGSVPASDDYASGFVIPPAPKFIEFPAQVQTGDVVFYRQNHASYFGGHPGGLFNHAALVVGWGEVTLRGKYPYMVHTFNYIPHIADHSSGNSRYGPRAINDTASQVNELVIVHIPSDISVNNSKPKGCRR